MYILVSLFTLALPFYPRITRISLIFIRVIGEIIGLTIYLGNLISNVLFLPRSLFFYPRITRISLIFIRVIGGLFQRIILLYSRLDAPKLINNPNLQFVAFK